MAESSKTLEAGAAHNINGTTNINLVYQKVSYAGIQKKIKWCPSQPMDVVAKDWAPQSFLACSKYGVEWGVGP